MRTNALRNAVLAGLMACSSAALAGNMSLEIDGVPAVQLSGFQTSVSNSATISAGGGAGAGKATFSDFTFKATQSAATPMLARLAANGGHAQTARVQVRSTDGTRLVSEWDLTSVLVTSVSVVNGDIDAKSKSGDIFLTPETAFSLAFGKVCQKVFAADGTTVSAQMCWDIAQNSGA